MHLCAEKPRSYKKGQKLERANIEAGEEVRIDERVKADGADQT